MIRVLPVCILAALMSFPLPAASQLEPPEHVVIVWLDAVQAGDLEAADLPNLRAFANEGALALLSTGTSSETVDVRRMRANAAATLGAGARARGVPEGPRAIPGPTVGTLGGALRARASTAAVIGDADDESVLDRSTTLALAAPDGRLPQRIAPKPATDGAVRSDAAAIARSLRSALDRHLVVLIDPGDTARAARSSDAERRRALRRADEVVGAVRGVVGARDVLVLISPTPSPERQRRGVRLGVIGATGPGFVPGLLSSGTTRRAGVLSLVDVAPTLLQVIGEPPPSGLEGRPARVHPSGDAPRSVADLETAVERAAHARAPLTRRMMLASMVAILLGVALLSWGRRAPMRWAGRALVGIVPLPLVVYLAGVLPTQGIASSTILIGVLSFGGALILRAALGLERSLVVVLAATAITPVVDLLLGAPLGHRSPLAFQIAGGGRFYGADEAVMGVVVGALLIAGALVLDRTADPRRASLWIALSFAAAVWVLAAPAFGSKFGAVPTAVPAFGVFAVVARAGRVTWRSLAAIALVTVVATAGVVLADAARDPEAQSHVARAVQGRTDVGSIIERKVAATARITTRSMWSLAALVSAAALGFVRIRRREVFSGRSHLRAAIVAAAVGSVAALAFNDGGIVVVAPITMMMAAAVLAVAMDAAPGAPALHPSSRPMKGVTHG